MAPAALQHQSSAQQSPANQAPANQSPPVVQPPPQPAQQTNEEATRAWLDRTIEKRRNANPPVPMQQPVERTVYVERPYPEGDASYGYDRGGQLVYGPYSSPGYGGNPYGSFPIHTALGAGMGAVIGNQFHHQSGQGAAIGAGVGLLLDLFAHH